MATDGSARRIALALALLVPVAALITVVVSLVEIVAVLARNDFAGVGFAVDWGGTAKEFLVVYAVLAALLLIGMTGQLSVAMVLLLPVALFVMMVITSSERQLVTTRQGLADVGFGFPLDWAIQDHQIQATPPPYELSPEWLSVDVAVSILWPAFAVDLLLTYAVLLGALVVVMMLLHRQQERADNREWESQRPEAERFGRKVDGRVGPLLSPLGWDLNLEACSAGPDRFAVLYERDFTQHEIWFIFHPQSGAADAGIPNWYSHDFQTHSEDEAVAYFVREAEAAIDAPDGLRHLDDDA